MSKLFRPQRKKRYRAVASSLMLAAVAVLCTALPQHALAADLGFRWDKPVSYTPPASVSRVAETNAEGQKSGHTLFQRGLDYFKGKGVPQDYAKAVNLWRQAAERGDRDAKSCLGYVYYVGLGVTRSYENAAKWYRRAAEAGAPDAQHNLGVMYYLGQGVAKDNVFAMAWLLRANANGYSQAVKEMRYIAGGSSPQQILMAQKIAVEQRRGTGGAPSTMKVEVE